MRCLIIMGVCCHVCCLSICCLKGERAPRFLGTPRKHEVSAARCVLVGLVEGC